MLDQHESQKSDVNRVKLGNIPRHQGGGKKEAPAQYAPRLSKKQTAIM